MGHCSSKDEKQFDLLPVAETLADVSEGNLYGESKKPVEIVHTLHSMFTSVYVSEFILRS